MRIENLSRVPNHPFTRSFSNVFNDVNKPCLLPVFLTNCDGFMNKKDELLTIISELKPKIIMLTELFPKNYRYEIDAATFRLDDYDLFISELGVGRGVAIHVHNSIQANSVKLEQCIFKESVWCSIKLNKGDNLLLGTIYRSPNSSQENNESLNQLMTQMARKSFTHILITGDFNYKEIDWQDLTTSVAIEHEASVFLECIRDSGLTQHVKQPTRFRQNQRSSVLDLVFTNEEGMLDNLDILPGIGASDHCLLSFKLMCYTPYVESGPPRPNFFKCDYSAVREDLANHIWSVNINENVDEMWNLFSDKMNQLIKDYVPLKNTKYSFRKQWMTTETAAVIDRKRRAWIRYHNCKSDDNYKLYTKARNEATTTIRYAKRDYERNISIKCKDEPKLFWSYVRKNTKTKEQIGDLKTEEGLLTDNPKTKAEILNKFFSSVFTEENTEDIPTLPSRNPGNDLSAIIITPELVEKKIKKLKASKAPGPDGIHNKWLLELCDCVCEPLSRIFNKSLQTGIIPKEWKIAHVIPIFKSGDKHDSGNYRPVSLTSICSRLLESIVKEQLMNHMEDNNLFTEHQFGFRSGYSCVTQLLHIFEEWSKAIDDHHVVDVIYLDFRKAFDTVPHLRLLNKLKAYGIHGQFLEWIQNFLRDRRQRVSINGHFSDWADVISGIPQGSVLGPTLFLIFINDLPDKVNNLVKIFADDTKIYSIINDEEDCQAMQRDLDNLSEWSKSWQLGFNAKKCKSMHIGFNNTKHVYTMLDSTTGNRTEILQVEEEIDLGVTFQSDLKFNKHIVKCVNKANKMIGIIRRTFTSLDKEMFLTLYKSMIRPYMEYATTVWSPHLKKDIFILENTQRRATKLVKEIKDLPYETRLRFLGLPTLSYRRSRNDMIQVYKILNQIDKLDKDIFFKECNQSSTRGHSQKLAKINSRLNVRLKSFSLRVINPWNSLPETCIQSRDINNFKSNLNECWKHHPQKFNHDMAQVTAQQYSTLTQSSRTVAKRGQNLPREVQRPADL